MTGIPGSRRTLSSTELASKFGAAEAGQDVSEDPIQVTVVLRAGGNADALRKQNPTRSELREAHRPNLLDLQTVVSFAWTNGLTVVDLDCPPRMVALQGAVNNIKAAFGTEVQPWVQPWPWPSGQSSQEQQHVPFRLRRNEELQVPKELARIVQGVFGIDNRKATRVHVWTTDMRIWGANMRIWNSQQDAPPEQIGAAATVASSGKLPDPPHGYTVDQVANRYNFPVAEAKGHGQTIAVLSPGGRLNREEFAQYFRDLGLEVPEVFEVPVDCELSQLGEQQDKNAENVEVALDVHIIAALVPRARIVIYYFENTSQGFIKGLAQAIYNEHFPASIISISFGAYEESLTDQAKSVIEDLLMDAKALKITVCCASGDLGAWDGDPDGGLHVDFPASSPHVLSCGGTTLPVDRALPEAVWSERELIWNQSERRKEHLASGGGESAWFDKPDWQCQASDPGLGEVTKRGVPDVAGFADPRNGFTISVTGPGVLVGGTSAAAPLWAGLIARIYENLGSPIGYLNPLLYLKDSRSAFRDITDGNNGKWRAREGWDRCTGLGRPDGEELLQVLEQLRPIWDNERFAR